MCSQYSLLKEVCLQREVIKYEKRTLEHVTVMFHTRCSFIKDLFINIYTFVFDMYRHLLSHFHSIYMLTVTYPSYTRVYECAFKLKQNSAFGI